MIIRFLIFAFIFYLVFKTIRNLLSAFNSPSASEKINKETQKSKKHYNLNEIEDIDYEEVDKNEQNTRQNS